MAANTTLLDDPRFRLYPEWIQRQVRNTVPSTGPSGVGGQGKMTMDALKAGAKVVVGTDSPNAFQTHGSLMGYVLFGWRTE